MNWQVEFQADARAELLALDRSVQTRVLRGLDKLARNPRSAANVKAIGGNEYRLRVGDWRIIYTLHDNVMTILVVRIGHRREVYR